jgi:hypothetical protein
VQGAKYYELEISPNNDFTNNRTLLEGTNRTLKVLGTRYAPTVALPVTSYFWRVRAVDDATVPHPGPWSTPLEFTITPLARPLELQPRSDDPMDPVEISNPAFSWQGVARASSYSIAVSTSSAFTSSATCSTAHTSFTPYLSPTTASGSALPGQTACSFTLHPGTLYYWRVRGMDAPSGVLGEWSDTASFVYREDVPVATSLTQGETTSAPVLSWQPQVGVGRYRITIRSAGSTAFVDETYATTYTPIGTSASSSPIKPGTYSWSVQGYFQDGTLSPLPSSGSYTIEAPAATATQPQPLTPADGAPGMDMPSMSWTPVSGAAYYRVLYGPASTMTRQYLHPETTKYYLPAVTKDDTVIPPGLYAWQVIAYSSTGAVLPGSPERTFRIVNPDVVAYIGPCAYTSGDVCDVEADTPQFAWHPVLRASHYQVTLAATACSPTCCASTRRS